MCFIDPLMIPQTDQRKLNTPIPLTTVLKIHYIEKKLEVELFNNSNEQRKFDMFIFNFHDFFQGLIGMFSYKRLTQLMIFQNYNFNQ